MLRAYLHTWEVDSAVVISINLVDHVLQLGFGRVLAKGSHNGTQLFGGDLSWTTPISI